MSIIKDLLYNRGNTALDIARLSSFISVICFWGGVLWLLGSKGTFDPVAVGGGCAAIFAGAAGWIYARQAKESGE